MKKYFINVFSKKEPDYEKVIENIKKEIKEESISICYSNQFEKIAKKLKNSINKKIVDFKQVLGCSNIKFSKECKSILLIGQGYFHAVSIAYESKLPVYILDFNSLKKVKEEDVNRLEKKEKASSLNYINSKKVGILISSKPGQQRLNRAIELKKKIKDKKIYLFISNNIDSNEFENFQIDSWINTACPRIDLNENNIININKLNL